MLPRTRERLVCVEVPDGSIFSFDDHDEDDDAGTKRGRVRRIIPRLRDEDSREANQAKDPGPPERAQESRRIWPASATATS